MNYVQRVVLSLGISAVLVSAGQVPELPGEWFPLDPQVGNVEQVAEAELTKRLHGKSALVVGGTDGIGRGTAIAMARAGVSVVVVGHSSTKAQSVLANMSAVASFPDEQVFKAYSVDLFTVKGCLSLTDQLKGNKTRFDYVILTVGMWPDWKDPRTSDGVDKVIALDVLARFLVTREVLPLLKPGARVMSALASTWKRILWRDLSSIDSDKIKDIATGKQQRYSLPEALGTASTLGDTWMQIMATRHPEVSFVGTFPGIVATDLLDHGTFPKWLIPFVNRALMGSGMETEDCGKLHAIIISSSNAVRRPVTYFSVNQNGKSIKNVKLEGRFTSILAYDPGFREWVWSFLQATVANHTNLLEPSADFSMTSSPASSFVV